jgi:hypothetical protein
MGDDLPWVKGASNQDVLFAMAGDIKQSSFHGFSQKFLAYDKVFFQDELLPQHEHNCRKLN